MKIIGFEDVRTLNISPEDCYKWVSEMIVHKRDMLLPAKTHMNLFENVFCNVMPSIVSVRTAAKWGDQSSNPLSRTYTKFAE